ncbi:Hypothetical predicted protein [Lecanosticta acicola]|uniref:DUF7918 domain-containing protein n=1 Tax=Lecanosticta acicola TaxID=111012 RepID=A0AAI8Z605_9PEZI|nr:Hypothetical predicted protein [Lecanosticta acicola]
MAVVDELPGVEVTITVDGQALEEYLDGDERNEPNAVTKFVEATTGKNFEIVYLVRKGTEFRGDCMAFAISVDGSRMGRPLVRKESCLDKDASENLKGAIVPGCKLKKFEFVALETVQDGHSSFEEIAKLQGLGCIKVEVFHRIITGESSKHNPRVGTFQPVDFVPERAVKGKALTQQVKLGDTVPCAPSIMYSSRPVDASGKPAATFMFNYRTNNALKSLLIIPRTPSPEPPTPLHLRDPTTLTPAEIVLLQQGFAAAASEKEAKAEKMSKVKREHPDDSDAPRKKAARPQAGNTLLELDEEGGFRESSIATLAPTATDTPKFLSFNDITALFRMVLFEIRDVTEVRIDVDGEPLPEYTDQEFPDQPNAQDVQIMQE